jgi:hypothetical protein
MKQKTHILDLPETLLREICIHHIYINFNIYLHSIRNLRLTCKLFNRIATPILDYKLGNVKHKALPFLAGLLKRFYRETGVRKSVEQLVIRGNFADVLKDDVKIEQGDSILQNLNISADILNFLSQAISNSTTVLSCCEMLIYAFTAVLVVMLPNLNLVYISWNQYVCQMMPFSEFLTLPCFDHISSLAAWREHQDCGLYQA